MTERDPGKVRSVIKAMALLSCLAEAGTPLPLGELSQRTGIPKATAHGLLAAMRPSAVVEQSDIDGRYRLGVRLFEYGCAVSKSWNILEVAAEPMRQVAEETGETVSVASLDRGDVLILDRAEAHSNFHVISEKGSRLPLHCTSQGKLLLAYMSPAQRQSLLRSYDFTAYTPNSHTSMASLEKDLAEIRERGYALENGELRVGLSSAAAPVFDVDRKVSYAVCVVGMFSQGSSPELQKATEALLQAARRISFGLGYRGQATP